MVTGMEAAWYEVLVRDFPLVLFGGIIAGVYFGWKPMALLFTGLILSVVNAAAIWHSLGFYIESLLPALHNFSITIGMCAIVYFCAAAIGVGLQFSPRLIFHSKKKS